MGRNIDDLADRGGGGYTAPGTKFHQTFLSKYPESQWPSYIDEIAVDISANIGISDTHLDQYNFPEEVGPYYRQGMLSAAGNSTDLEDVIGDTVDAGDLGTIVFQLNRLSYDIEKRETGLENVQHAVEAVLEKLLTQETGLDFSSHSHQDTGAIADVVMELFSRDMVARQADTLVEEFESNLSQGLLARLDEPQMMTPLWGHQLDALRDWKEAGYRGYADMATATGKTVLGLAAIALRYGHLHPIDELSAPRDSSSKDRVLIVAHSDLILEQWRREFDRHLNIPEERTQGADEIDLTWGQIHFRTPQRLLNQSHYQYDLVVLDEAHHYATGTGWGEVLEEFDDDVLALSGSVDDAGTDSAALQERLQSSVGPEIKRYGITEAQDDGIIPAFDWEVRYAPFQAEGDFVSLSETVADSFDAFRERVEAGEIDTERPLKTFEDVRTFSHTVEGKELKRSDEAFRELSTGLFSRRTKRWHLSPALDAIGDIVEDHSNDHVVVLVDSNAQVTEFRDRIRDRLPSTTVRAASSDDDRATLRDQLDEFNDAEDGGVLVGTGDLLGEGVDIPRANVAVNMATAGVNPQLVQRIGRVLRNPSGDKHAHFYNVVGVPRPQTAMPEQDGRRLIEETAEFCGLGNRFNNLPAFAMADGLDDSALRDLLLTGRDAIVELVTAGSYERPEDPAEDDHLSALRSTIEAHRDAPGREILAEWSEYSWIESAIDDEPDVEEDGDQERTFVISVDEVEGRPVPDVEVSIVPEDEGQATLTGAGEDTWECSVTPDAESVTVEVTAPGCQPFSRTVVVDDVGDKLQVTLAPVSLPDGFEISGPPASSSNDRCQFRVTTADGKPVRDASISLVGSGIEEFVQTDESGIAEFPTFTTDETVRVAVRHSDRGIRTGEFELPGRCTLSITMPVE